MGMKALFAIERKSLHALPQFATELHKPGRLVAIVNYRFCYSDRRKGIKHGDGNLGNYIGMKKVISGGFNCRKQLFICFSKKEQGKV
jgi:hypothetical protein